MFLNWYIYLLCGIICDRSRAKRGEVADFFGDIYRIFRIAIAWSILMVDIWCKNKKYSFSLKESIFDVTRPFTQGEGDTFFVRCGSRQRTPSTG